MKAVNQGQNQFCGPAVLSIITGKNVDQCVEVINRIRGTYLKEVKEVTPQELIVACDKMGFDCLSVPNTEDNSLYWTLNLIHNIEGLYFMVVPHHVVAIEVKDSKVYFCDNHTKEPINAAHSARLGQKILKIYQVIERPKPQTYKYYVKTLQTTMIERIIEVTRPIYSDSEMNQVLQTPDFERVDSRSVPAIMKVDYFREVNYDKIPNE